MTSRSKEYALPRWLRPMNRLLVTVQRAGLRTGPVYTLTVRGRRSGKDRTTPVTPFEFEGGRYVVGGFPGADWVANARAAGAGVFGSGRRRQRVRLVELSPEESRPVLAAFPAKVPRGVPLMRQAGIVREGTPEEYAALAGRLAVFRIEPADDSGPVPS
ncbi:deazaflavin-dependent oxidoreductase, nitroreductase family [Actinopolymorpha singaporensis]|uniref:Deazaflavin-dependent oxidoreductase, nitroreductase family n=2 Tax=Actinopolymorpha singaporensis TaxID=117157 RepID=A0A1H1WT12_9ACTN|nr:deazaflavin-dependent oxidoreductase, nitroreductase family [Actinopolymorpha singaporensis]